MHHPEHLTGVHLNLLSLAPGGATPDRELSDEERVYVREQERWSREGTGYAAIQGTRPQTLAYGLTDSPTGLAAWVVDKMHAWSDHDGDVEQAISRDRMLANISLYWFTGAIGSSFWPYRGERQGDLPLAGGRTVDVPVGYAAFPAEIRRPPRSLAAASFPDIRRWTEMPRGGHFAALEQPASLAADVAAFFRDLR